MVTTKYYIEDLIDGFVLKDDGTWNWFTDEDERSFSSYDSAYTYIETDLEDGVYRVFSRIKKVS